MQGYWAQQINLQRVFDRVLNIVTLLSSWQVFSDRLRKGPTLHHCLPVVIPDMSVDVFSDMSFLYFVLLVLVFCSSERFSVIFLNGYTDGMSFSSDLAVVAL